MCVSESTISRELKRNQGKKGYRPKQAQIKADNRKKQAVKALKMTPVLILLIETRIRLDWSPVQVSGQLEGVRPQFYDSLKKQMDIIPIF
jgi:transposase, IS30 family